MEAAPGAETEQTRRVIQRIPGTEQGGGRRELGMETQGG